MSDMSARGALLLGAARRNIELLEEHRKAHPEEVERIYAVLIAHVRSSHPQVLIREALS